MESVGLLNEFLKTLLFALASGLAAALVKVATTYIEKLGFEIDEAKQEKAREVVVNSIMKVEERYLYDNEFIKYAEGKAQEMFGVVSSSKAKLAAVVVEILAKLPGIDKEEAIAIVHQEIPKLAELGIGGLGKQVLQAMREENYRP
jgi:hypothetical protein